MKDSKPNDYQSVASQQLYTSDTIAAVATASGCGGIGIVRLSGPKAHTLAQRLTARSSLTPRTAHYTTFHDVCGEPIDTGLTLFFPAPHSFTGEDVIELQGHGGPIVLNRLLRRCFDLGARQARPGEFSERAFLNDKLDLVQAEAIADLINAQTETAARLAQLSLRGDFSKDIHKFANHLLKLRVYVEAAIDFPEEEIDFLSDGHVQEQLSYGLTLGDTILKQAQQGVIYQSGATVVLAGKPNAGKSSLMNNLAGDALAIVTNVPGTTRDLIREHINIADVPIHLIDTAGLRQSEDIIEQEGIRRAQQAIADADLVLHLVDDNSPDDGDDSDLLDIEHPNTVKVLTKIDQSGRPATSETPTPTRTIAISNMTGDGLSALKTTLLHFLGVRDVSQSAYSARERHLQSLTTTLALLKDANAQFQATGAGELLAEDLRRAHDELGKVTGVLSSDDLLGEIFSSFCIGK